VPKLSVKLEGDFYAVVQMRTKEVDIRDRDGGVIMLTWGEIDSLGKLVAKARGTQHPAPNT